MIGSTRDKAAKDQTIVMGITDLMTSLAVIFILLLTLFIRTQFASRQVSHDIRKDLIEALNGKLVKGSSRYAALNQVVVREDPRDPLALTVEINIRLLGFAPDQRQLPEQGKDFLDVFIPLLSSFVCEEQAQNIQAIVIEGHTDPTAPPGKDPDEYNIPLSQDRARSVMQYSLDLPLLSDLTRNCFLDLTSVNGRGRRELPPELIGKSELTVQDYEAMRRVVFKIRIKSTEQRQGVARSQTRVH